MALPAVDLCNLPTVVLLLWGKGSPTVPPSFPGVGRWPCYFMKSHHPRHSSSHLCSPRHWTPDIRRMSVPTCLPTRLALRAMESSSPQPTAFPWASLPRGQPQGHLSLTSLRMARKSCWPGLVEPPRQSLTTGATALIWPALFPLWLAPGSNLFIMLGKTHPPWLETY